MNVTNYIKIKDNSNQRIDNFLITKLKLPKTLIYKLIRLGKIKINFDKVNVFYKLKYKDVIYLPKIKNNINIDNNHTFNTEVIKIVSSSIIYEDNYLIIINKPTKLPVHNCINEIGIIEICLECL